MATAQYTIRGSQRDDLAAICALGSERLFAVAEKLHAANMTIRQSAIERIMQPDVSAEDAALITRVVLSISSTFRRTLANPKRALDQLGRFALNQPAVPNWDECRPAIQAIMEAPLIAVAAKAIDISYDFERVFIAGRLLTSIRPVFDPPRDNIVAATIVQTLRLEYVSSNSDHYDISIAMDLDDIRTLRDECTRAIDKAKEARSRIESDCGMDTIIPGEEENE